MSAHVQIADGTVTKCSTTTDCYRFFAEEMDSLYRLAFLLTADNNTAEQCFVGGLGECVDQTHVSAERARSWARLSMTPSGSSGQFRRKVRTSASSKQNRRQPLVREIPLRLLFPFASSNGLSSCCQFSKVIQTKIAKVFSDARGRNS